ncbi:class I SAM-dependent methyltransferase [Xanthovirga aplysinae]|uniref:class I SAM-dependent methyltransferase n=1 Tax=Xanthovirga aplysinae TaxID=2529853 RepID=UPI0012BBF78E|nr:class I SAM-dependent methyltransferase [Xanthovirga aplysinae]MTI33097.1 class I SAM-dependent methyltransferase [Xanthovirga aplysinae]
MKELWNERYKNQEFVYGKDPNLFFKEWLKKFKPGSILMPADGEGRNGVFAARMGWKVTSFDLSVEGRTKAFQLAKEKGVTLDYRVGDFDQLQFERESFDVVGLVFAHFSAEKKSIFHKKLNDYLKPGGIIIFEAFSKKHLNYYKLNPKVGGRMGKDMLFSEAEIMTDFENYEKIRLQEEEIQLNEGKNHIGRGSVIRFVGRKVANQN